MSEGITIPLMLPGDIPGLLRRGSPVQFRDEDTPWTVAWVDGDRACATPLDTVPLGMWGSLSDFSLDLSDPTGCVHAAWWLSGKMINGTGPIARTLGIDTWEDIDRLLLLAKSGVSLSAYQTKILHRVVCYVAGRAVV